MSSEYVAALQAERAMCARRGQKDRVAAIDAELKKAGAAPSPAVETAALEAPETTSRPRAARKSAAPEVAS